MLFVVIREGLVENTTSELYHGWEDNDIRIIEKDGSIIEFAEHVLSVVIPKKENNQMEVKLKPGSKWFIPGLATKRSHEAIKNMCVAKGMAVICVNGNGIVITMPETLEVFRYKKDDEFNNKIIEFKYTQAFITSLSPIEYSFQTANEIICTATFVFNQLNISLLKDINSSNC